MIFYFHEPAPGFGGILRNYVWKLYPLILRLTKNHIALHAVSFGRNTMLGSTLNSSFNMVIDEGHIAVSGDVQQCSKYGCIIHHGLFCIHVKYHIIKLGHMVVMNSWNVDIEQRQRCLALAESSYIMSVWNSLSYLLVSIKLLSQDRVTIICNVQFRIYNIAFTMKGSFEGHSNWKHGLNYIVRLWNKCIFCVLDANVII